jgi:putative sterol carrier protein
MALAYGSGEWEAAYQEILKKRLQEKNEPYIQGTPEWLHAYEKLVQADTEYREYAQGWEGTVAIHSLADPETGIEEDAYMLMDLWHGECRSMRIVPPEVGEGADFVLTGSYWTWKRINRGEMDTNKAVMQGKLKLNGDLPKMVRYGQASTRLTELSIQVGGRYLDELSLEEKEDLKKLGEELKAKLL